jgi:hypothetical protein
MESQRKRAYIPNQVKHVIQPQNIVSNIFIELNGKNIWDKP